MNSTVLFDFKVDKENKQIRVDRSFDAPTDLVWSAWTKAELLDQWWAPKPFKAVTKSMDFREGGRWHYYMESPEGQKHWCLFDYETIVPRQSFTGIDAFCDENAQPSEAIKTRTRWSNTFEDKGEQTVVHCILQFNTFEELETIISMGFKEGFTAGLENLDEYIAAQFYLRKTKKPSNKVRTSSYVNMNGNTEEAFQFYKAAFKTEFVDGIQRLGEAPENPEHPLSDELKKMVLHVELPLLGGHILMGTDAPEAMGFTLKAGNNMHICLEPDSREEADRLFNELSVGGVIDMPMADMFFGAYFGSFQDKFGINWMINFQLK